MPYPMKIQPVNSIGESETLLHEPIQRADPGKPPVLFKSRLRRLFDRQFPSVLKSNSTTNPEKSIPPETPNQTDGVVNGFEFEPSSVCLAKMVQNFIEENNEKHQMNSSAKCGRSRCNCFNGNTNDSSDDELDPSLADSISSSSSPLEIADFLKGLITCGSVAERNLLADVSRIIDRNKQLKRKEELRAVVSSGLTSAGYDASICKSRWKKSGSYPAGEYEYIDVVFGGGGRRERVIVDVEFRAEFEIARSTGGYKAVLGMVPCVYVGRADRLQQIVSLVCEAARQSLRKKGMHFPPWRKAEYMKSKWLAPYTRAKPVVVGSVGATTVDEAELVVVVEEEDERQFEIEISDDVKKSGDDGSEGKGEGELELIFRVEEAGVGVEGGETGEVEVRAPAWHPPPVKPRSCERSGKAVVTGLAFLLRDSKP